jgi:hypothetical protein
VLLVIIAVAALAHEHLFRMVGSALVIDDGASPSDIIVIAADADGAGVLEASDLVRRHVSNRVAVFTDPPEAIDLEFERRGVPYFNAAAVSIQHLHALGVSNVEQIERKDAGTGEEAKVLPKWCADKGIHSLVFISTTDHARRTRRVLRRALRAQQVHVQVHPARFSEFDADGWWHTRGGVRTAIIESQKLLLDVVAHPGS